VSGATTAAELLALADDQLHELTGTLGTDQTAIAAQLAAGWPKFHTAGERLLSTVSGDQQGQPSPAHTLPAVGSTNIVADVPDPRLLRAADLLDAAADLLTDRNRDALSENDRRTDAALASVPLLTGAYQVAHATLRDPLQFETAASAVTAVRRWSTPQPAEAFWAARIAGSFDDASTLPSAPTVSSSSLSSRFGSELDLPLLLTAAVHDWQRAALAVGRLAAPSSLDLRGTARAAGSLLALSQILLRSHPDAIGPDPASLTATVARLHEAGHAWNTAADWGAMTTATPADPVLVTATSALDHAITLLGRTAGRWAAPHDVAERAPADQAYASARAALMAVQAVGEQHSALIARLARTGGLYAPASQVTPTMERVPDRLARRWVPVTASEAATLTAAYQQLPDLTATARLAYTALTSPSHPIVKPPDRLPLSLSTSTPAPDVAQQAPRPDPRHPVPTLAEQRWHRTCLALDPRLITDPHWPALAGALDRVELAGVDVTTTLAEVLAQGPLPEEHAARTLHYRLIQGYAAATTPYTVAPLSTLPPSRTSEPPTAIVTPNVTATGPRR
jgi:hypothetical protein